VVDVSEPESPRLLATFGVPDQLHSIMAIVPRGLFLTNKEGMLIVTPLPIEAARAVHRDDRTLELRFPALPLDGDYSVEVYDGNQQAALVGALTVETGLGG
jgi:hypothetical protein